ncbi:hypothetical protein Cni_G04060 [Canna indica]|uniref:CHCH domain-containing protein n=1 Tax=Canna indica TaxID=4628 RepID=A0AAQ3JTX2_9LILI|nr:hypothetical protein Cni_G04060 [Canna indica]
MLLGRSGSGLRFIRFHLVWLPSLVSKTNGPKMDLNYAFRPVWIRFLESNVRFSLVLVKPQKNHFPRFPVRILSEGQAGELWLCFPMATSGSSAASSVSPAYSPPYPSVARFSDSLCYAEYTASIKCLEANVDKSQCQEQFDIYKECKKKEREARLERNRKRSLF